MQAELKAVQQQALATQQSLKKIQARESVDPYATIFADMPGLSSVSNPLLGVGSALALGLLVAWWYLWHRPVTRFLEVPHTVMPTTEPPNIVPIDQAQDSPPSTASGEFSTHGFEPSSSFARRDPNMGFDPEAAATEVIRVRKSLADKREARAHFLEREDGEENYSTVDPDLDLDLDLDAWHQPGDKLPGAVKTLAADEIYFSLGLDAQPPQNSTMDQTPAAQRKREKEPDLELDLTPESEQMQHTPGTKGYDFAITLALAQESAALELWSEARELAGEVMESDDSALVSEALSLLERLNKQELDAPPDTNWNTMR